MPRFYIAPEAWNPDLLELTGAEAHHCVDVLRMGSGDSLTLFNGCGKAVSAEVDAAKRGNVRCRALRWIESAPPACQITLAQAVPKGKTMEWIIEKATELGASRIVPLLTERTIVQMDAADGRRKQEKWQRIAIEASKQCGQNWVPTVSEPQTPRAFLGAQTAQPLLLIGSLEKDARRFKDVLGSYRDPKPSQAVILIGPEGDFSPGELAMARERGGIPVSFGSIVLRTETAAIYSLSVLAHELG